MKKIKVTSQISLEMMDFGHEEPFFSNIFEKTNTSDEYRKNLQKKYKTLEAVKFKIDDAVNNKRLVDGTPDFFIFYDGKIAGMFEFHPLSLDDHLEVGYWLYEEFRGRGILSSIFPVMISYANQNFSKNKILATTSISNIPSQKLLAKIRFIKTGRVLEFPEENGTISKEFEYILPL